MDLRTLLEKQGGRAETTGSASDVSTVVRRMSKRGIGSLVACDRSGRVQDDVDERDVEQVMAIMTHRRVRHVLVMGGEALLGVIRIGDVLERLPGRSAHLQDVQLRVHGESFLTEGRHLYVWDEDPNHVCELAVLLRRPSPRPDRALGSRIARWTP